MYIVLLLYIQDGPQSSNYCYSDSSDNCAAPQLLPAAIVSEPPRLSRVGWGWGSPEAVQDFLQPKRKLPAS